MRLEAEYRPFEDGQLTMMVEAAVGAAAAVAFGFGPIQGAVYMTLSIAIGYRKTPDSSGSLHLSLVLVVAGHVNYMGLADLGIVLRLRLEYRSNGDIFAKGFLSVKLRICSFLKIRFKTEVIYRMRDGRTTKEVRAGVNVSPNKEKEAIANAKNAIRARN